MSQHRTVRALLGAAGLLAVAAGILLGTRPGPARPSVSLTFRPARQHVVVLAAGGEVFPSLLLLEVGVPYRLHLASLEGSAELVLAGLDLTLAAGPGQVAAGLLTPAEPFEVQTAVTEGATLTLRAVPSLVRTLPLVEAHEVALLVRGGEVVPEHLVLVEGSQVELGGGILDGEARIELDDSGLGLDLVPGRLARRSLTVYEAGEYELRCPRGCLRERAGRLEVRSVPPEVAWSEPWDGPGNAEVGGLAPDFVLQDLTGRPVRLADYRGQKVVLINFWATWCPPCRVEMPEMEEMYRAREGELAVLAVNLQERPGRVAPFMEELGLTFPALLDLSGKVATRYMVWSLPTTYVVDRAGVVRVRHLGPVTRDLLEQYLEQALAPGPAG